MCNHKKWTEGCNECDYRFKTVKRYSHSREVVFPKRASRNKKYYGIELEVECGRCDEDCVLEAIVGHITDTWEFKHDGSLDNGIEFESQPLTSSQWFQTKELEWVKYLPEQCKSHDTTTCGLHIHVNRDGFDSNDDIRKINYFLHIHQDKFEKLGRRRWGGYCRPHLGNTYTFSDDNKYRALNLSRYDTIEFRFPKGTLKIQTIKATIALINAICEIIPTFTKEELDEGVWDKFMEAIFTGDRGETSRNSYWCHSGLFGYLKKHNAVTKSQTQEWLGE